MSTFQTAPMTVVLAGLTFGCLRHVAASLEFDGKPKTNGCYKFDGPVEDLQAILADPRAATLLRTGYPNGIPDGERIELMGIRFPARARPAA
jgi:hypothetical protein